MVPATTEAETSCMNRKITEVTCDPVPRDSEPRERMVNNLNLSL